MGGSPEGRFCPRGHGAMSGDIWGCHTGGAPGIDGGAGGLLSSPPSTQDAPSFLRCREGEGFVYLFILKRFYVFI